jgi:NADPH:quinone reductase-like Zn-dependent oxidoreductase
VDVVLESIGGETARRSIGVLRPDGLLVTIVGRRDFELAERTRAQGRRFAGIAVEPDRVGLEALADLVDGGRLRVHVAQALPLDQAAKAHELLETGRTVGKIVLIP